MRSHYAKIVLVGLLASSALATPALAVGPTIDVIYCKKPGHPKASVPGTVDFSGSPESTEWKSIDDIVVSPDGSRWAVRGRSTTSVPERDVFILLGSGLTGSLFTAGSFKFIEGQPAPTTGLGTDGFIDFFLSGFGRFNDSNKFVFGIRTRTTQSGSTSSADTARVFTFDGTNLAFAFKQLDLYTGLSDTGTAGDETVGNSVGSFHIRNDGVIGTQDSSIGNISALRRPAITYDRALFKQSNVSTTLPLGTGTTPLTITGLDANSFYTTPDNSHWYAVGKVTPAATALAAMMYDGRVVLQEGSPVSTGGPTMGAIFQTYMANNGLWIARGRDNSSTATSAPDWVVKNGALIAKTGDPITPGNTEKWGDTIGAVAINRAGDYLIVGNTDNADASKNEVVVLNGTTVILREGDPIDLDGNGLFDDNAFVGRGTNTLTAMGIGGNNNSVFWWLDNSKTIWGVFNLRDNAVSGNDLNVSPAFGTPQAFVRIKTECKADFNNSGSVTVQDLLDFFTQWLDGCTGAGAPLPACTNSADFNGVDGVSVQDILDFISAWLVGC